LYRKKHINKEWIYKKRNQEREGSRKSIYEERHSRTTYDRNAKPFWQRAPELSIIWGKFVRVAMELLSSKIGCWRLPILLLLNIIIYIIVVIVKIITWKEHNNWQHSYEASLGN
jgi:hypothetical protein